MNIHVREVVLDVEVVVEEGRVLLRGRALRAAPPTDRRGSPIDICRLRRAEHRVHGPGLLIIWMIWPGKRRCRCGGGRGFPPRRARRRATAARTDGSWARAIDLASEVLPTPGGPEEGEDGRLRLLHQGADREESRMRSLILLEPVVVLVQDLFGALEVEALAALLVPTAPRSASRDSCARPSPRDDIGGIASRRLSSWNRPSPRTSFWHLRGSISS